MTWLTNCLKLIWKLNTFCFLSLCIYNFKLILHRFSTQRVVELVSPFKHYYRNPTLRECEDETHTLKMGTWESSGTPKFSEFDCKGQNTSHWGVLYTIGKLSKCRCRKWAHMSHSEICSTSYGKKKRLGVKLAIWFPTIKSQESTRPRCVQGGGGCNTQLKSSQRELQLCFRPRPNRRSKQRVTVPQSYGRRNRGNFGTPPWESQDKKPFGSRCYGEAQRILYGGKVVASPESKPWWVLWV